jgi:hypothetical protein
VALRLARKAVIPGPDKCVAEDLTVTCVTGIASVKEHVNRGAGIQQAQSLFVVNGCAASDSSERCDRRDDRRKHQCVEPHD